MVRELSIQRARDRKALLAVGVATLAILWHLLACIEGPMSFSPDGETLALVTMEPYADKLVAGGGTTFRLFLLHHQEKLQLLEKTSTHLLTAPSFSPDGDELCYLRMPLLTEEEADAIKATMEKGSRELEGLGQHRWQPGPPGPATRPAAGNLQAGTEPEDRTLPRLEGTAWYFRQALIQPILPVQVVTRDATAGEVTREVPLTLPAVGEDSPYGVAYTSSQPLYSRDGQWVYMCIHHTLVSVHLASGRWNILAAPARSAALSPDGRTLAFLHEDTVGQISTDGRLAHYLHLDHPASPFGLVWQEDGNLLVLRQPSKQDPSVTLEVVSGSTGRLLRTETFTAPCPDDHDDPPVELVISPDGKHMVIGFGSPVHFMDRTGEVLRTWNGEGAGPGGSDCLLNRPTFTPDGSLVACKCLNLEGDEERAFAVAFFTPEGKEVARVAVPPIAPPEKEEEDPAGER